MSNTICLIWISWFATAGVAEAACTVIDLLARHCGVVIPASLSAGIYIMLVCLSGFLVLWVVRSTRDLRSRREIEYQAMVKKIKLLQRCRPVAQSGQTALSPGG